VPRPRIGRDVYIAQRVRVDQQTGCHIWTGTIRKDSGYGQATQDGKSVRAHVLAWEQVRGPVPAGLQLDHVCGNRACVNADHLEPRTPGEHVRRHAAMREPTPACKRGHVFTPENTYTTRTGKRQCRVCMSERNKRWRDANAEAVYEQQRQRKGYRRRYGRRS
jgi:hypothetical protein